MDLTPQPRSVARRTATGAVWIMAWRMLNRSLGLVSTLILVRLLEPTDFGLVAIASGFVASVDALSALGVQDALVREKERSRDLYDTGFGLTVLRGLVTAVLIGLVAWPLARFFSEPRLAVVMLVLAGGMIVTSLENIGTVDFRRNLEFDKEFRLQMVSRIAATVTTIGIAAIFHSYWALVAGIAIGRFIRLLQSYTLSDYRPKFAIRAWRRIIGFSLWTWAFSLLIQARERTDNMFIGYWFDTTSVGLFSVGTELGTLPTSEVVEPLNRALFSGFVAGHHRDEGPAAMFLAATGLGFLLTLPAGFGISMIAEPMVRLTLGERWIAAVPIIEIMAIASSVTVFSYVCGALLNALGLPRLTFWLLAASVTMRLPLLAILLQVWGLAGAALAVAISLATDQFLFLWFSLPRIGVTIPRLASNIWRPAVATFAMAVTLWAFGMAWTGSSSIGPIALIWDTMSRAGIGALAYTMTMGCLWWWAGCPEGPERIVIDAATSAYQRFFERLR